MFDLAGLEVLEVTNADEEVTCVVTVDGHELGKVTLIKFYERAAKALDPYIALWAGPTLCVIDRRNSSMWCIDRDDVTHRIHALENVWIIEGELDIDLFDPESRTTLATYSHGEVITGSSLEGDLLRVEDFAGTTFMLDPHRSLEVVGGPPEGDESGKRSRIVRWGAVVGNVGALPLYWATAHSALQRVASFGMALVIAAVIAIVVAGGVVLAWSSGTRRGALAQLIALTPFVLFSTVLRPPEVSYILTSGELRDPRVSLGLLLFVIVPGLLIGASVVWMRRIASKRVR